MRKMNGEDWENALKNAIPKRKFEDLEGNEEKEEKAENPEEEKTKNE